MGRVFAAEDERLGRTVAVKLLPEEMAADPEWMARFEREAIATSRLNHPGILVVHELGEDAGRHFLVTERVDGESLRQRLQRGPLPIREAVGIAHQVASALAVAHRAGVVHRDVKPENLMLRPDGWVKLLDFGLAKVGAGDMTRLGSATAPGVVLGTPFYMSPEQARSLPLDGRSDLFSLGAVLYEAVAGRRPFPGDGLAEIFSAILHDPPAPLAPFVADVPPQLERIVARCLEKDPRDRPPSAEALADELRELADGLDRGSPSSLALRDTARTRASRRRSRWARRPVFAALAVIVVAAVLAGVWLRRAGTAGPVFGNAQIARVTHDGLVEAAAMSADGRHVAYSLRDGEWSVRLHEVPTGADVELLAPGPDPLGRLALAPDGEHLYVVRGGATGVLLRVPIAGGEAVEVVPSLESPAAFSPAGDRFAFLDWDPERGVQSTYLAGVDGGGRTTLLERGPDRALNPDVGLAWHPDGRTLAAVAQKAADEPGELYEVLSLPLDGGAPSRLGRATYASVSALAWRPDGRALFLAVAGAATGWRHQIVEMTLPDGEVHPVTADLENYEGATLTADGARLLSVRTQVEASLWTLDPTTVPAARPARATQGPNDGYSGLAWTADGAIVHVGRDFRIYRVEPDGRSWLLTPEADDQRGLALCPGGDLVVESWRERAGPVANPHGTALWRLAPDGGSPRLIPLEPLSFPGRPACSPDGRFLVYQDFEDAETGIFRVPAAGGERVRLYPGVASEPAISPEGSRVAFFTRDPRRIVGVPIDGGPPLFELTLPRGTRGRLAWSRDGSALTIVVRAGGVDDLWLLPIDGGPPRRLTDLGDLEIFDFAWGPDGRLVLSRGSRRRDAVLLTAEAGRP